MFAMHYLDDFLLIGPFSSPICQQNLDIFTRECADLGVPLATEKVEGPGLHTVDLSTNSPEY